MRRKALKYLGKLDNSTKESFGYKSRKCPLTVKEMTNFEEDLRLLIKNLEHSNVKNESSKKLADDIKVIKNTKEMLIKADKSRNIYRVSRVNYKKYLVENITKTYKKSNKPRVNSINKEPKKLSEKLKIANRMERTEESEAYITVEDHKKDFPHKPSFRLISPSKSELGKVSKCILDNISKCIIEHRKINQCKNSASVIEWFKAIENKQQCTFIVFNIESFYPSISLDLFNKTLKFAKEIIPIADSDLKIAMHSQKTLLLHENETWVKRKGDENFHVPMGCLDGAEICDLTSLYILIKIKTVFENQNDSRLYRDNGLGILRNLSGPRIEKVRNEITTIFKECGSSITTKTNLKVMQFLDIELDLINNTYRSYKSRTITQCIAT